MNLNGKEGQSIGRQVEAERLSKRKLVKVLMRLYLEGPLKPSELGLTRQQVTELVELGLCTKSKIRGYNSSGGVLSRKLRED